jgi:2-methylcitrate dehydratase PrpD
MAAASGVAAARLAASGASADLDRIVSGPGGFAEAFGASLGTEDGRRAIEENWIKAYPCCLQTHGAIEAALAAREEGGIEEADGEPLEVAVHRLSLQAAPYGIPADGLEAKFSIPYLTSFAILHGAPGPADFSEVDPDASRFAKERVLVRSEAGLGEPEAVLRQGDRELAWIAAARGSPRRPLDAGALAAKRDSLAGDRLEGALDDTAVPAAELLEAAGLR